MAKNGEKASRVSPAQTTFRLLVPNLTAESSPRLRVLAFRSMRVAEASLRSRRRYFLGGKEKIRRRAAFKKINLRQLRRLQKQLTRV